MRTKRISKIAVAGAAASMAFATAIPALACDASGGAETKPAYQAPSLTQQKAWLDALLVRGQQRLSALASKVAADPRLTSAQRSAWASWIAGEQAKLTELKSAVDAATTLPALHQAVRTALAEDGWFGWFEHDSDLRQADPATPAAHLVNRQPSTVESTVVLRNRAGDRRAAAGQHRATDVGAWQDHRGSSDTSYRDNGYRDNGYRDNGYRARHGFGDHRSHWDGGHRR